MQIRPATPADESAWRALWKDYLAFYRTPLAPEITAATWARCLDPAHPMALRLAEVEGRLAGFALYLPHASSWSLNEDCYLEDLYVAPEARGQGVGRTLLDDLVALARSRGWARLYWMADRQNARARALYDSFTETDDHLRYRLVL